MTPRKRGRRQRLCTKGGEGRSTVEVIVCALSGTKQLPRGRIGRDRLITSGKQPMGADEFLRGTLVAPATVLQ